MTKKETPLALFDKRWCVSPRITRGIQAIYGEYIDYKME